MKLRFSDRIFVALNIRSFPTDARTNACTNLMACELIKYNGFQISGSNLDQTPYLML